MVSGDKPNFCSCSRTSGILAALEFCEVDAVFRVSRVVGGDVWLDGKRAFSRVEAKIWNEMPASLRELPKKHFQTKLHSLLLDILKNHDDYIDISQITSALKTYN